MKLIKIIWSDIKKGENLNLYVTVFATVVVLIVRFFLGFIFEPTIWSSFTIAILALLAISMLGVRHQLEKLLQVAYRTNKDLFLLSLNEDLQHELTSRLEEAKDIMIFGTSLSRTIHLHYNIFKQRLEQGKKIKFVVTSPQKNICDMVVKRNIRPTMAELKINEIMGSLYTLSRLREETKGDLEIRIIEYPLDKGGILIDTEQGSGLIYIWYYGYKSDRAAPKHILQPTDKNWYKLYLDEFNSIYYDAKIWNPEGEEAST